MDLIEVFLKLILCSLPFVLLCILAILTNLPKSVRYVQFPMPLVALVYGIVVMLRLDKISQLLLSAVQYLIDRFEFLSFLSKINWTYGVMYVFNFAMVLGFMLLKFIVLPILLTFKSNQTLVRLTAGKVYNYDEKEKRWYLKKSMIQACKLMKWMYIGGLIISSLLFVVTYYFTTVKTLTSPFYPAFGLIILGEVYFLLCGQPKEDKADDESFDPIEETEEVEYELTREAYENLFPDRISGSFRMPVAKNKEEAVDKQFSIYEKEYEENASQEARLLLEFFRKRRDSGEKIDETMMLFTQQLLAGKCVLFMNQFYEDSTSYVFLPVVRHLMHNKNILIILGRSGAEENIERWFRGGISSINSFADIWKVAKLSECDADTSVAILPLKDIYNQKLLQSKSDFLSEVSMVFVMDPTRLLGTMQIGLSSVISFLKNGNQIQYIAYDRNCDGLVDSLSHVLGIGIELVGATAVSSSESGVILWDADGELLTHRLNMDISRYLGVGTDLASVAIRRGVSKVTWLGYQKFPVADMRWIAGQYYVPLCKSMDLNISQTEFENRVFFQSDMWALPKTENAYLIVEDEYNNQFETARQFSTRGIRQTFLHVISQNYWLRDYMAENADIFRDDPKSIPNISPDYQRSKGNTVYKLVFRLICGNVPEDEICDILEIINVDSGNLSRTLCELIQTYFPIKESLSALESAIAVETQTSVDSVTYHTIRKRYYSIRENELADKLFSQLKVSYYIAEDERDKGRYLGSVLYGHVYQKYLPGVLVTLEGKYYEIVTITKHSGVVVRRAADHINSRRYYRYLRKYSISSLKYDDHAITGSYGNFVLERGEATVKVDTFGYLEMKDYRDMQSAKKILVNHIEQRCYLHKNVFRIDLGENCSESVRITIANLLNELFVTVFPDSYEYITATTCCSGKYEYEGYIPELELEDGPDHCLYIIEDSLIDLGLLINVDRYFVRFMEILCDALVWHNEMLLEEQEKDVTDEGDSDSAPDDDDEEEEPKKESWMKRVFKKIKGFFGKRFGRKKKKSDDSEDEEDQPNEVPVDVTDQDADETEAVPEDGNEPEAEPEPGDESEVEEAPEENGEESEKEEVLLNRSIPILSLDQTNGESDDLKDLGEDEIEGSDSDSITVDANDPSIVQKNSRLPYSKRCFLLYGYETVPAFLDIDGTLEYLKANGFDRNYLEQARSSKKVSKLKFYNYEFEPGIHYCDFCGRPMEETFDVLDDGRERCPECSRTAITKLRDFKKLYKSTRKRMEDIFGIKIRSKVKIMMVDAGTLAESLGKELVLTPGYDCRTLGYAYNKGSGREIWLENGSPSLETEKTLVHELTHIWQYVNLLSMFNDENSLLASEGMAVWTEVQYLVSIGETERAQAYIQSRLRVRDEYGEGLARYLEKFPIAQKKRVHKKTPFCCSGNPLD